LAWCRPPEGKGLRQLTRETCSAVARLTVPGEIKSLNVSNAAVLALYIGASKLGAWAARRQANARSQYERTPGSVIDMAVSNSGATHGACGDGDSHPPQRAFL